MKKRLIFAIIACFFNAQAVEIKTAKGVINVPDNPKKVVSLDIGTIDTLNALNIPIAGIPDNLYIKELKIDGAKAVGTLFEPDIESMIALSPDWILVATLSAKQLPVVGKIAPAADMSLQNKASYTETIQRMHELAKVFHKEELAKAWQEKLDTLRDSIKAKMPKENKSLILLTTGNKMSVFGRDSRFGWLDKTLGFDIVKTAKDTAEHGAPVSFEFLKDVNPDWLLVIDRASAMGMNEVESAKILLDNHLVKSTTAWKKGQIIYLRPADVYVTVGGVQSIHRVLKQIDESLSQ